MIQAADRMKALGRQSSDTGGSPSSIFGSAAGLAQTIQRDERFRISVYPLLCAAAPEMAMGIAACLCYLLEQYPDTRVYRCFAKIDDATSDSDDESGEISAEDYQFQPSDWELEGLADNVLLFGELAVDEAAYTLRVILDMDLLQAEQDEDEVFSLSFTYESLAALMTGLPAATSEIMATLGGRNYETAIIAYAALEANARNLDKLLAAIFEWNLDIYLSHWGLQWEEEDIQAQFLELVEFAQQEPSAFAFWVAGLAAKQVMQTGLQDFGEFLLPDLTRALPQADQAAGGAAAIALGLADFGHFNRALDFLQPFLRPTAAASVWQSMIQIHLASGDIAAALDSNQLALESGLSQPALHWQYAQLLMAAEANDWPVEEVLLIDPDAYAEEEHIPLEIAAALKLHLAGQPENLSALQLALSYMIDVADDELWLYFEQLVQRDRAGELLSETIDRLIDLEDHAPAYEILERYLDDNPFAYAHLAQLALADDDSQFAIAMIAACRSKFAQLDEELELELQRLELYAKLPAFEATFAEIKVLLNAKRLVAESAVDLLEEALEIAPQMVDIYVILARCYLSWKDSESAIEVLEEAEKQAGEEPQLALALAQIFWAGNQQAEAIEKLNAGLRAAPGHVPLLVQMANYLLANDQLDDARAYIARAEAIAPSHRALWQTRRLIAQKMAQ